MAKLNDTVKEYLNALSWLDPEHHNIFLAILIICTSVALMLLIRKLVSKRPTTTTTLEVGRNQSSDGLNTKQPTSEAASWNQKVFKGLEKTREQWKSLASIFQSKKIDNDTLEKINETLFKADIGVTTADILTKKIQSHFSAEEEVEWTSIKTFLIEEIAKLLSHEARQPQSPDTTKVTLIIGVNGVGKTTSIGKLCNYYQNQGKKVLLGAADTYRAAAIDQLKVWGDRLGTEVIHNDQGTDPASVAFDSVKASIAREADLLFIDTAGRLHNKKELMDELNKINKVVGKALPGAPHETLLVIDATTGQNAIQQIKAFSEVTNISGLVITKLDGTAKGGAVIGIAQEFKIPIRFIGVGEQADDLKEFDAKLFSESLFE